MSDLSPTYFYEIFSRGNIMHSGHISVEPSKTWKKMVKIGLSEKWSWDDAGI